jgi:hypothetical protein
MHTLKFPMLERGRGVLEQFPPSEFYGKLPAVPPCIPSRTFPLRRPDENLTALMSFQKMLQIIQGGNFTGWY